MSRPLPPPSSLLRRQMELYDREALLDQREQRLAEIADRLGAYQHLHNLGGAWGAWITPAAYADALIRAMNPERIERADLNRLSERLALVWVGVLERDDPTAAGELAHRLAVEGWIDPEQPSEPIKS